MPRKKLHKLYAVDIFSGAGGLTTGLKAGGFHVVAGVELEDHAVATFKVNHPEVHTFKQDATTVSGHDLLAQSPNGRIDLLAGCPPCQGFTSLTSKYRREDKRNQLVREMARLAEEVKPAVIMMENVPGLARKGSVLFDEFLARIKRAGYIPTFDVLQVADYGVPQSRRRLVVLAGLDFKIDIPPATHSRTGEGGIPKWRTVESVLKGLPTPITLTEAKHKDGCMAVNWHVVRTLAPQNQKRLRHAKPGQPWASIPKRLRPECHQDKNAGFSNVYGRMRWDNVSPTITAGCTTLSKGRFGHPEEQRTISVYEAALLQTFPEDYIFACDYMEYVCSMIGNALPCHFAAILAKHCNNAINNNAKGGKHLLH